MDRGSYQKIIQNIKLLDDNNITTSIRINVDAQNEECIEPLLDELKSYNLKNCSVYFGLLEAITTACASIASNCMSNEAFSLKLLKWNKMLFDKGMVKDILNIYPTRVTLSCAAIKKKAVLQIR